VLQDTVERIYAGKVYADVPRGIFLVRGENVLLLGEVVCGSCKSFHARAETNVLFSDGYRTLTAKMKSPPP
jgi:hypothetical protein